MAQDKDEKRAVVYMAMTEQLVLLDAMPCTLYRRHNIAQEHTYQITRLHAPKYRNHDIDRPENNKEHTTGTPFPQTTRNLLTCEFR